MIEVHNTDADHQVASHKRRGFSDNLGGVRKALWVVETFIQLKKSWALNLDEN